MRIFLMMVLLHIIEDFHLQGIMKEMKQKNWWLQQKGYKDLYENDYKVVLFLHSLSWSIMISLPILFFMNVPTLLVTLLILINTSIHFHVDDLKCNKMSISLMTDQTIHLMQIIFTLLVCECYAVLLN